ncbi:MAG: ATP-binding protein [Sandaracinaceae bacterium]|nr:ATP-binding protein [Sandaracinaceae bacterium]
MEPTLPGFGTSFVGRAGELAQLDELAAAGEIVVVTGPPGVGKSRLVAQWAAARGAEVARVPLAAARDLEDALRRVARALELDFGPSDDEARVVERIGQVLRSRAPLLWLDDADAVIELLADPLARWLDGSARDGARGRTSATRELPSRAREGPGEGRRRAERSHEEERARSSPPPPARGRGLGEGGESTTIAGRPPPRPASGEGAPWRGASSATACASCSPRGARASTCRTRRSRSRRCRTTTRGACWSSARARCGPTSRRAARRGRASTRWCGASTRCRSRSS